MAGELKGEDGLEHLVYMNWRTGELHQFRSHPGKDECRAQNLEHVFLCYHDGSDCVFVDPASKRTDARYLDIDLLTLKEFRAAVKRLGGESLPLMYGEKSTTSQWTGESHSRVVNATVKRKDDLLSRMDRLGKAISDLIGTIEELSNAKQS